jgi:hypothetical protein
MDFIGPWTKGNLANQAVRLEQSVNEAEEREEREDGAQTVNPPFMTLQ